MSRKFTSLALGLFVLFVSFLSANDSSAESKKLPSAKKESPQKQSLILKAPPGWVLDTKSAASKGIHLAFYPTGSSWQGSDAIMYADGSTLHGKDFSVEQFIAEDIGHFRSKEKGLKVNKVTPLTLSSGKKVPVYRFEFPSRKALEEIAYIEDNRSMVIVVLSARSEDSYRGSQTAFRSLVTSYRTNTSNPEKKPVAAKTSIQKASKSKPSQATKGKQQKLKSDKGERTKKPKVPSAR